MAPDSTSEVTFVDNVTVSLLRDILTELQLLRAAVELQQPGVDSFDLVGNDHGGKLPG